MRSTLLTLMTVAAACAVIGVATPAAAGDDLVKSGTLTLKGWKVAFIGSAGQSKGELTFQGKTRKFKMTGLGIGGVGISTSEATPKWLLGSVPITVPAPSGSSAVTVAILVYWPGVTTRSAS